MLAAHNELISRCFHISPQRIIKVHNIVNRLIHILKHLCRESHPLILEDIRHILLSHDSTSELVKFFAISYSCVLYFTTLVVEKGHLNGLILALFLVRIKVICTHPTDSFLSVVRDSLYFLCVLDFNFLYC